MKRLKFLHQKWVADMFKDNRIKDNRICVKDKR